MGWVGVELPHAKVAEENWIFAFGATERISPATNNHPLFDGLRLLCALGVRPQAVHPRVERTRVGRKQFVPIDNLLIRKQMGGVGVEKAELEC